MQFLIDKKQQDNNKILYRYRQIGWIISSLILNPLDRIKKQLQISDIGTRSGQQEGVLGFWKNFMYRIFKDIYLFNVYEYPEKINKMNLKNKYLHNILKTFTYYFLQTLLYPFDIIQVRLEDDVGNNKFNGYFDCVLKTYREFGIQGFFVGLKAYTFKFIVFTLIQRLFSEAYTQTIKYKYRYFIKHPQPIPYWKFYFFMKPTCSLVCHPIETYRRLQIFNYNKLQSVSIRQLMSGYKELLLSETIFLFLKLLFKKLV